MSVLGLLDWSWSDRTLQLLVGGGIIWALLGLVFASRNGNGCWGCLLGALLGPVGLIISLLIPPARR